MMDEESNIYVNLKSKKIIHNECGDDMTSWRTRR